MVFQTPVSCQLRSFRPPSPDNGLSDPGLLPTSVAYYGPSNLHQQTTVFMTPVSNQLRSFGPQLLPITVLPTSIAYYGHSDLHRQITFFLTSVSCGLRSFRLPSPPMKSLDTATLAPATGTKRQEKCLLILNLYRELHTDNYISWHRNYIPLPLWCAAKIPRRTDR
ncbi:hypothetical protein KFK09_001329 [Dendrobium nobile]|uniref:Uncharacterized protein n=1 Tax=Dendrobium nobile TaxID=94219 RepID=A0A8T3C4J5_DENNO|nr:hypothetical protein KFK09_001329 [Dendrobium nobile]